MRSPGTVAGSGSFPAPFTVHRTPGDPEFRSTTSSDAICSSERLRGGDSAFVRRLDAAVGALPHAVNNIANAAHAAIVSWKMRIKTSEEDEAASTAVFLDIFWYLDK